jgi:DNA-binding PucR family transcriptional regulator
MLVTEDRVSTAELLEAARREIAALTRRSAELVAQLAEQDAAGDLVRALADERYAAALGTLAAYDAKRRGALLDTLVPHLGDRGALAATARALFIHTNTLRQRLERIEALTGLDLAQEDLLSLELTLKLERLHGRI